MVRRGGLLLAAALLLSSASAAQAQDQGCTYEGTYYPEGSVVCQAGLLQACVNGDWENNDGARCDDGDGDETEGPDGLDD